MINNEEILNELMDWFDKEYPGVHNEVRHSKCLRDTGYNLTAILKDLKKGGISETIEVSKKYWQGAASQLGKGEREYAVAVNNKLGDILVKSFPEQKEKVIRLIANINDVVMFGVSSDLKGAMKFRENIRFFKQDEYPDRVSIDALLRDAHSLVPHKNNMVECNVNIYGPEYAKEKEALVLNTMCGVSKENWRPGGKNEGDFVLLKKIYENWRERQKLPKVYKKSNFQDYKDMQFNEQVRAPYLLVFSQRLRRPSPSQVKRGFADYIYKFTYGNDNSQVWYLSAAMLGYAITLLAADRGMYAAFCKCFMIDENNPTILDDVVKYKNITARNGKGKVCTDMKRVAFTIGLGYRDKTGWYPKETNYMERGEYMNWL